MHRLFTVLFPLLWLASAARAAYDAKAPASLVSYTSVQKEVQRAEAARALGEMKAALDAGRASYTFRADGPTRGVYRFGGSRPFDIWKRSGFSVIARGCTFLMDGMSGELFLVAQSRDISIVGPLTIDADPLQFSQARVLRSDATAKTMDIEVMKGYPQPPKEERMMLFGADGVWLSPQKQWPFLGYKAFRWLDQARRLGRIAVEPEIIALMRPGLLLTLGQGQGIGTLSDVEGMTIQDVTLHTGCTALVAWGAGGSGAWRYSRVRAIPRPGTSRLIGGSGPQQSFGPGSRVSFVDCEFSGSTDDNLNVSAGSVGMVYKRESARVVTLLRGRYAVGDTLRFLGNSTFAPRGQAQVLAVQEIADQVLRSDAYSVQKTQARRRESDSAPLLRVTLDADVAPEQADTVENLSARGELFEMRGCKWTNSTVRVMVQGFKRGVFENNLFTRIGQGLSVTTDLWWWEGGSWDSALIRGNTFRQTPYVTYWNTSALRYGPAAEAAEGATAIFGPVEIARNTIEGGSGNGIGVHNASGYTLRDNAISKMTGAPVTIEHSTP